MTSNLGYTVYQKTTHIKEHSDQHPAQLQSQRLPDEQHKSKEMNKVNTTFSQNGYIDKNKNNVIIAHVIGHLAIFFNQSI